MKMNRFNITEVRAILIFLVLNFIGLGIILSLQNYYFGIAQDQRQEQIGLTSVIHKSDASIANKTDTLINNHIQQDVEIHTRQAEIVKHQADILHSLSSLNQTIIQYTHQHAVIQATIDKLLNVTRS